MVAAVNRTPTTGCLLWLILTAATTSDDCNRPTAIKRTSNSGGLTILYETVRRN